MRNVVHHGTLADHLIDLGNFDLALAGANAGGWAIDFKSGKFTYTQSVLDRLTDHEIAQINNAGLWSLILREDLPDVTKLWQRIMRGEAPFDFTYRLKTEKEGLMWQRSTGALIRDENGKPISAIALVSDITAQIDSQTALKDAKSASDMQSRFLARVSHEIRTPLNAITGYADSLQYEDISDFTREVIDQIIFQADELNALLTQILDYSKLSTTQEDAVFEALDTGEFIASRIKKWKATALKKGLILRAQIAPDAAKTLQSDRVKLSQCLDNLLSNAIKFSKEGTIWLAVKPVLQDGQRHTVIAVKDCGIGMTKAQLERAMKPFGQADETISRHYGGTGLGLNIVHQTAEQLHGQIKIKSSPGQGTIVALVLPQEPAQKTSEIDTAPQTAMPVESTDTPPPQGEDSESDTQLPECEKIAASSHAPSPTSGMQRLEDFANGHIDQMNVLCVEDNPVNRDVVRRLLDRRVGGLRFAEHGKQALDILSKEPIDVVLMDIHMPVMNGIEATLEIRKSADPWANVVIIALTADAEYQNVRLCRNIGMNDTVTKPVKAKDITDAFERAFAELMENRGHPVSLANANEKNAAA